MPTQDQVETTGADLVRILNEALNYAADDNVTGGQHFAGPAAGATSHEEQFRTNIQADYSFTPGMTQQVETFRAGLNGLILSAANMLAPMLREYGAVIDAPETDAQSILTRIYDYFIANSQLVLSRGFTFGTPTVVTGATGTGTINRLNVDENNYDIETQHADSKVAKCVADENSGASKHEEVFEFRGQERNRDNLVIGGSGLVRRVKALSARDSLDFISNPSFSDFSGTLAVPTAITDWTFKLGTVADVEVDETTTYRDFEGDSTARSLKIKGPTTVTMNQNFSTRRLQLNPDVPVWVQIAVNRPDTATTGNLTLKFGGMATGTITLASLAVGWNVLSFSQGLTLGGNQEHWYKQIKETAASIQINTSSIPSGSHIFVDDIVIGQYTEFDGAWYAVVGGATKFLRDDEFNWSDTATDAGLIQKWLWRAFNRYLPSTTSTTAVTWTEPT